MNLTITEEPLAVLAEYACIPIAFEVRSVLDLEVLDGGLGGFRFAERPVAAPYAKDYDAYGTPLEWPAQFDLSHWGIFLARSEGRAVGGATVAFDTPGVDMLEGRRDLAVLWDIRVRPEVRGRGVGTALFRAAEAWAASRGCRRLKIETQNVNVAACRFYRTQGCTLGEIRRFAYDELPDEVQLLWYKDLA